MQYKVPQNVDIEDRVIGPLTLRQFMIILVAVGLIIILNFVLVGILRMLFYLFVLVIGGIAGAFAFVKYGDQKLEIFAFSALKTFRNPRKRIWKKEEQIPQIVKKTTEKETTEEKKEKKGLAEAKNDLETLAQLVDSGGYSKVGLKDRVALEESQNIDDSGAKDVMGSPVTGASELNKLIENSKPIPQKREPLISEVASISPDQNFDYPKIEVSKNSSLDKII